MRRRWWQRNLGYPRTWLPTSPAGIWAACRTLPHPLAGPASDQARRQGGAGPWREEPDACRTLPSPVAPQTQFAAPHHVHGNPGHRGCGRHAVWWAPPVAAASRRRRQRRRLARSQALHALTCVCPCSQPQAPTSSRALPGQQVCPRRGVRAPQMCHFACYHSRSRPPPQPPATLRLAPAGRLTGQATGVLYRARSRFFQFAQESEIDKVGGRTGWVVRSGRAYSGPLKRG